MLFRLKGHKGPVTSLAFLSDPREHVLVSSSKDTLVKFWDLRVQHCFKTLTGHVGEVWDFALIKNDSYLVTGKRNSITGRGEKSSTNKTDRSIQSRGA